MKAQLDICFRDHEECVQDSPFLPTRVLDLGSSATVRHVKISEPPPGTPGKYIALSYCWGDGGGLKAIRSNLSKLLQEVDEDELPATIRDAIELARCLGVRYLWVDSLCIIQDDTQDWIHESAQMSTVYAQAFLTISASSVGSSRFSFLHQSRRNSEALFRLQDNDTSGQHQDTAADDPATMLAVRRAPSSGFHQHPYRDTLDPTMCRAWTLQEYMLSTRVVSFSTDEVQWTCRKLRACECGHPEKLDYPRMEDLQRRVEVKRHREVGEDTDQGRLDRMLTCLGFWSEVVEAYGRRDLSWMRDKLPALSGVASEFFRILNKEELAGTGDILPSRYLAGLWGTGILRQLCWRASDFRNNDAQIEYRAPTWSWASVEGTIYMDRSWIDYLIPQAEILEAMCALANPNDPFGQVVRKGTYLRVRATVVEARMTIRSRSHGWVAGSQTAYGSVALDCEVEEIPLNTPIWGQHSAGRTVQRRRGPTAIIRDNMDQSVSRGSKPGSDNGPVTGSDTGSDAESERERGHPPWSRREREDSDLGGQFTVWLLHMADTKWREKEEPELVVLCRPAGDEEVYERIGYVYVPALDSSTWTEQVSGEEKSIVTIV